jgi:hypothetical protein
MVNLNLDFKLKTEKSASRAIVIIKGSISTKIVEN